MEEYGRGYKTSDELLEDLNDSMNSLIDLMAEFTSTMTEGGGNVGENALGDAKTQKSIGGLQKFAKALKSAPQIFILEQLMKLLEPFLMLLEPIAVVFDILSGLFSVFTGEIMKAMFEALQPVFDLLVSLTPIFKILGQLFAIFMKVGMIPLTVMFEVLNAILEPFLPLFEKLSPIFELLGVVLSWLITIGLLPLVAAIYAVGLGIAALINFFTWGLVDAVSGWNSLMLPIMGSMVGLKEGGIVTGPRAAIIGEGNEPEAVVPLSKAGQFGFGGGESEELLTDIRDNIQMQTTVIKRQGRGVNRRRFGG